MYSRLVDLSQEKATPHLLERAAFFNKKAAKFAIEYDIAPDAIEYYWAAATYYSRLNEKEKAIDCYQQIIDFIKANYNDHEIINNVGFLSMDITAVEFTRNLINLISSLKELLSFPNVPPLVQDDEPLEASAPKSQQEINGFVASNKRARYSKNNN